MRFCDSATICQDSLFEFHCCIALALFYFKQLQQQRKVAQSTNLCPDLSDSKIFAFDSSSNHGLAVLQPGQQAPLLLQQSLSCALLSCKHRHQALPVLLPLGGLLQLGLQPRHLGVFGHQGSLGLVQPCGRRLQHRFRPSQSFLSGSQCLLQFRPVRNVSNHLITRVKGQR